MSHKLNWVKEAFSRHLQIMQDGRIVGEMLRDVFGKDVTASLNGVQLRFDVNGFLFHSVNVHRVDTDNQIIGHIELKFGKQAELNLTAGETYLWKRHNMLMREWDMILESPDGSPEREIVSYDLTRRFFEDAGDITVSEDGHTPNLEVVILTGLFIRNYFQRRRRTAVAAS